MREWYLYVVRCGDGTLYAGISTDVDRRLAEHRRAGDAGAKYLKGRQPLTLVLQKRLGSRSVASRAEAMIKKLPKAAKEMLICDQQRVDELVRQANE
jgi:putative endonuclease